VKNEVDRLKHDIVDALKEERWDEALADLEVWCERFPEHGRSWLNQGYCQYRLGRWNEAVASLDRCLEIDPSSTAAKAWRKKALIDLDRVHTVSEESHPSRAETVTAPGTPSASSPAEPSESVGP
jgi:tetratricopeptide (TPR) repeat protein